LTLSPLFLREDLVNQPGSFGSPAYGADDISPQRGNPESTPTHIVALKSPAPIVADPFHPHERMGAAGLRDRIIAAHRNYLPLRFSLAPAHHQHHQQSSCGEPEYGLHYHVVHDRRFSFLILGIASSTGIDI
jgi:hypothetical protein